jgi:hypothetical protein
MENATVLDRPTPLLAAIYSRENFPLLILEKMPSNPSPRGFAGSKYLHTDCMLWRCIKKGLAANRRKSFPLLKMRETGFEPAPLAGLDPKSSASANSATLAHNQSR